MNESAHIPNGLAGLILVRLLPPSKSAPSRSQIVKDLQPFFSSDDAGWANAVDRALQSLKHAGRIEEKPIRLTEAGRKAAAEFLGLESPPQVNWSTLQNRYLMARALGISASEKQALKDVAAAPRTRAAVLVKHYRLPGSPVPTEAGVKHLLAWQQLRTAHDIEIPLQLPITHNGILWRTLLKGQKGNDPLPLLAAEAVKAKSTDVRHVRQVVIREWLTTQEFEHRAAEPQPQPQTEPTTEPTAQNGDTRPSSDKADLSHFAERVKELARSSPTGRFGDNKVFLSHIWQQYQSAADGNGMTRDRFNQLLVEANRHNLLTLSRADLVSAMNPDDVRSSELRWENSTFHFIRTDR
jgi:hypothetical protein